MLRQPNSAEGDGGAEGEFHDAGREKAEVEGSERAGSEDDPHGRGDRLRPPFVIHAVGGFAEIHGENHPQDSDRSQPRY